MKMAAGARHLTIAELEAGLDLIRQSPKDSGVLQLIVRRPRIDEREVLEEGILDLAEGLVGDTWKTRRAHPDFQLTITNSRAVALVAQEKARWPLAGDQLFLDLDLSVENLPAGTRLAIGTAVIEVTAEPHNGCKKFAARFGLEAREFVNSAIGKQLHLRGINAKIIQPGVVRVGDLTKKL
jgi:MOSC domain-containing protein YiiM